MSREHFEAWERSRAFLEHVMLDLFALILLVYSVISTFTAGLHLREALGFGLAATLTGASRHTPARPPR